MFVQIEPHPAGFSQGMLIKGSARFFHASTYVSQGEDGASDFEGAFDRLEMAVSVKGFSLTDIVSMTIMLCDARDAAQFRQVRASRLKGCLPASTLVTVEGFDGPERMAAIEIVAARYPPIQR